MNSNNMLQDSNPVHGTAPTAHSQSPFFGQSASGVTQQSAPEANAPSLSTRSLGGDFASHLENNADNGTDNTSSEDTPQGKKRTRMTNEQRNAILRDIVKEHTEGQPVQAIMLRHDLSRTQVEHFQVDLFHKGLIAQKTPLFEAIKVTDTVKKLLGLKEPWDWIKLEKGPDGRSYVLTEFTGA